MTIPPASSFCTRPRRRLSAGGFVAGHIHQAPVGVAGPVVVPLFVAPAPATNARHIKQSRVATPNTGTTGADLCQNPSAYYVNYHTTVLPAGAIRGQLH